jgi:hypothetical protein
MSYVAGMLLLNMECFEAFCCMANLLSQPLLLSFYQMDMSAVRFRSECALESVPILAENLRNAADCAVRRDAGRAAAGSAAGSARTARSAGNPLRYVR